MSQEQKVHNLRGKVDRAKLKAELAKLEGDLKSLKSSHAPKQKIQEKELEIEETKLKIRQSRSLKLDKDGSKKNKKKKGKIKKFLLWTAAGGVIVALGAGMISLLAPSNNPKDFLPPAPGGAGYYQQFEEDEPEDAYQDEQGVTSESPYKLSLTYEDPRINETLTYSGYVDLGHYYVLDDSGTSRLVRTSPKDMNIHDAFDNSIIPGIAPEYPGLIPLYSTALMEGIVQNGTVEAYQEDGKDNYHIAIDMEVLGGLVTDQNAKTRIGAYTDENGNAFSSLAPYLDSTIAYRQNPVGRLK